MKLIILEYPEDDQAQVFFVDLDLVDESNPKQVAYRKFIQLALKDMGSTTIDPGICFSYGGSYNNGPLSGIEIEVPNTFDESVTLYIV